MCVRLHVRVCFIQIALREQETAVAVQDMEVRQMELDAQRRIFEQVSPRYSQHSNDEPYSQMESVKEKADFRYTVEPFIASIIRS